MLRTLTVLLFAAVLALSTALVAVETGLPTPGTLDGLGVNIHFTHAKPGELEQLAAAGFRWVRMDFAWGGIEREKGVYDFSAFDHLLADLDRLKLRAYFILDYGNRLYDGDLSPHTDEGRAAFCAFVAAAMMHYQGRGIVWEMWNEPNIGFWKPKPNVDDYIKLALAVGRTIREVAPKELFVGPTTSEIDLRFLEATFAGGCLQYWDAVSVHPYRHRTPETAADDYRVLRRMIARHAPKDAEGKPKAIPILSGEWGYSSSTAGWGQGYDEVRQGRYLPRQWLTNLSNEVPISIWYDWHDDGEDEKEAEHRFGTVRHPYRAGQAEVCEPKPAYLAAKTLTTQLAGYRFSKRLALKDDEFVLLFAKGDKQRLVVWTTADVPRLVAMPASKGRFRATAHLGNDLPSVEAGSEGLAMTLTGDPVYLTPESSNDLLRIAASWDRLALEYPVRAPENVTIPLSISNHLDRALDIDTDLGHGRSAKLAAGARATFPTGLALQVRADVPFNVTWRLAGLGELRQRSTLLVVNPLSATLLPLLAGDDGMVLPMRFLNPSGEAFTGRIGLFDATGLSLGTESLPVTIPAGATEFIARIPLKSAEASYRCGARVATDSGIPVLQVPTHRYHRIDDFAEHGASSLHTAYRLHADGDSKVASTQDYGLGTKETVAPVHGPLAITYRFEKGWKFIRLAPSSPKELPGKPVTIGMWVKSDRSANVVRLRVTDSTGQTFQPDGGRLTWDGWQWCEFVIAAPGSGHWGGANDGVAHPPLKLETLFLLDQANQAQASAGTVQIAGPVAIE